MVQAAAGSLFSMSTYGSTAIEDAAKAVNGAPQFFQIYMSKDDNFNKFLIDKAVRAGVKAIIMTVDSTLGGYREEDVVNKFQFPLPMPNLSAYGNSDGADGVKSVFEHFNKELSITMQLAGTKNIEAIKQTKLL